MPSSRSTNTMAEFLQRMLGDIAEAKTLPDADLGFLIQIETTILQKLRAPIDALMGQMQAQGGEGQMGGEMAGVGAEGGQAGLPQMPMIPPGVAMGGGGPIPGSGGRVPGLRMEPNMPNPDELRRMLGGAR